MLLMLLLLWLARSPLGIAAGRLAVTIATIVAIAACGIQNTTAIADDRYDRNRGLIALEPAGNKKHDTELLREGTLIPPTVGRIVILGRRWAFIPASHEPRTEDELATIGRDRAVASMVKFTTKPRPTRLGAASSSISSAANSKRHGMLVRTESSKDNAIQTPLPQVLVVENLMLQRIAEAIRADGTDDRWTVSGEVMEYFNENQLLIRTAQRAGSQ